jgi:hypothetical protein
MKFRSTLAFVLSFGAVFCFAGLAFAQTAAPAAGAVVNPQTAIVTILALIAGFIGQAVNSGSLFGIATTPKAWVPYLTLLGSFLAAAGVSLQSAPAINGSAVFNAVIAGFLALTSAAGGAAANSHLNAHKTGTGAVAVAAAVAAKAADTVPPAAPPAAPAGGGK